MHIKLKKFAGQLLFASNVFIAFLLFFENQLVIPVWLQTVGRMHPLILHFPIVILLIAMLLEFFRFKPENFNNQFYRNFSQNLLLVGALFAAVTVIMGLFLSREEGYGGETLTWHKWTGAGIFFLASFIYWIRNNNWYKAPAAKVGAMLTVIGLILTGHYGAALTHGDNFIFEPILAQQQANSVPLEEAVVYNDIIRPIFEQKCVSCHNPDKLKGELILSDPTSIKKGGKSGKLYVPGNPAMSLLLQRVHLPVEDKKHMPPSGKAQLTPEEVILLSLWVKQNSDFNKRVVDLPEKDSLRMIASSRLKPAEVTESYDFSAADDKTITKLNNDYRTVAPLAKESPALSVNIYNQNAFSSKQLEELSEVSEQIVSLNLTKMPVKDEHLKLIAKFVNLRRLDLNFTGVTGKGLNELSGLKHLKYLTLSGTLVNYADLEKVISTFKGLRSVTLWNTPLTADQLAKLQNSNRDIRFVGGFKDDGKDPLKLNTPQLKNESVIFTTSTPLQLKHPIKGVELRFTTDGTEPDSSSSAIFSNKTVLKNNATVKVRAFKQGWYGSDLATFNFYKSTFKPDSLRLLFPLNRVHQAEGAHTFFDKKLGDIGANNPAWANNWGAVRDNDMVLLSQFYKPVTVSSVGLRYMIEEDTGIFPPAAVEIWGGTDPGKLRLLTTMKASLPAKGDKPVIKFLSGSFKPETITYLKIVGKPVVEIPEWHRNKGKRALLLVDEMFIN
ncbi:c-type cytochrome domain-containing protein [Dyadobacter sp. CY312]|uniref:c-type cytochrome domain-containing protein n=1 Tax=Dyadobacter sp. CY312 TaxID=2907303 RepID=UPI001F487587|nr:c-type cytochrome domain-containing protein [Dyadobacter sp. CY312]MCE7041512.1 chitobiase/beta-hexosaminidase C-terminal domain-containing protein [Dyadobacter sp. CY312]